MNGHVFPRDEFADDIEEFSVSQVDTMTRTITVNTISDNLKIASSGRAWISYISNEKKSRLPPRHRRARYLMLKYSHFGDVKQTSEPAASEVATFDDPQGQLQLRTRSFHPSKKLIDIWRANIRDLAKEGGRSNVDVRLAGAADYEIAREFTGALVDVLGSVAQYLRYADNPPLSITNTFRFSSAIQIALCEEFLIVPDQAYEFLNLLNAELRTAFKAGWQVNAAWGSVKLDSSENLVYRLSPVETFEDPNFIEATDAKL
jgi:hypothetical protein